MNLYSAYDYLAYVVPGGVVLLAVIGVLNGGLPADLSAGVLVVLLGASFLVGHAVAAVASWLEPVAWGHWPGNAPNPLWGLDGTRGYSDSEIAQIEVELRARYGSDLAMRRLYQLAYTEIQQTGKAGRLNTLNSQIGFYRNAAAALILAAVLHAGVQVFGEAKLPIYPWVPLYAGCGVLFAFRYRRYWRQFGDNVIRGIRVIDRRPTISEPSKTSLGSTSSGMEH